VPTTNAHARRRTSGRSSGGDEPAVREAILKATAALLAETGYSRLRVHDILAAAEVARGSFYFYFAGKQDVLAELVRRAVAGGLDAAQPWLGNPRDKVSALRAGITAGAQLWQRNGPILRAIVENWRDDPVLTELWQAQMGTFTQATIAQIAADRTASARLARLGVDVPALAASLTWLGERLYYLAATATPPFDRPETLVETLLYHWTTAVYGKPVTR
jgi:AcrR family transcriptional regulator